MRQTLCPEQITYWLPMTAYAFWPLKVVQGHANIWLPISDYRWPRLYLAPFPRYSSAKEVDHPTLVWTPKSRGPPSNFVIKLTRLKVWGHPSCCRSVTIHQYYRQQTTDYDWTLNCNIQLKTITDKLFVHSTTAFWYFHWLIGHSGKQ